MTKKLAKNKEPLTLDALILTYVDDAYPDGLIRANYNPRTQTATKDTHGDGLANFIVREICETNEQHCTRQEQLEEAIRVMSMAENQLHDLVRALQRSIP